ncbi:hypothetical protein AGR3A_Cc150060 [Agrobacterium tomkonis CFBP 6623]|uniref:Uncharacterized protein n=1 Tax=Agrobacterium tomkonis CFBP 6623 TaxID=1183432 RepID=A0A1S7NQ69_9HYPH|nr:hypothetical protein AGR3A_Cc150060 [Agrobacterium tomkonis CFBP 6623]
MPSARISMSRSPQKGGFQRSTGAGPRLASPVCSAAREIIAASPAASSAEFIVSAAIFESRFADKEILSHDIVIRMALVSGQESNKLYAAQNPSRPTASNTGMRL